jgi:hypothetical protein
VFVQDNRSLNLLASSESNSLWATILQALASFPKGTRCSRSSARLPGRLSGKTSPRAARSSRPLKFNRR